MKGAEPIFVSQRFKIEKRTIHNHGGHGEMEEGDAICVWGSL